MLQVFLSYITIEIGFAVGLAVTTAPGVVAIGVGSMILVVASGTLLVGAGGLIGWAGGLFNTIGDGFTGATPCWEFVHLFTFAQLSKQHLSSILQSVSSLQSVYHLEKLTYFK